MKKLVLMSALVLLLLLLTLGNALAMDMEDPVLCVAGQWLTVDRVADQAAVTVLLPAGTAYGNTAGCTGPNLDLAPELYILNVAVRQGNSPVMHVEVNGADAWPVVQTSYGGKSFQQANNGKRVLVFQFNLH
jgi:hypothetical protein